MICFIVITIDSDDDDVVIIEDSETEDSGNGISTDNTLAIQPNLQDNQGVSRRDHRANSRRNCPDSVDVESSPVCKRRRSSTRRDDYMGNCHPSLPEQKRSTYAQTDLVGTSFQPAACPELQQPAFRVEPVFIVEAEVHREQEPVLKEQEEVHREQESVLREQEEVHREQEPTLKMEEPVLRMVEPVLMGEEPVLREQEQVLSENQEVHRESPPPPKIISARSLQPHFTGGNPYPCLAIMSYFFNEDAENNTNVSSARAAVGVPTAMLPQRQSSLANNPEIMNCSASLENSSGNTDTTLSSLCIPPNFGEFEMTHMSYFLKMPEKAGTSQENIPETMNYPTLLGNESGQGTSSSSVCSLPNDGNEDTSLGDNLQTVYYPTLLGTSIGQVTASSSVSIPPSVEMLEEGEPSLEKDPETMNYSALLGNESGQCASCSHIYITPSGEMLDKIGAIMKQNPEGMNYPPSLENNSDENTPSSSLCNLPNFALLPVEMLVEAETNKEDGSEVMNNPVLLENDSGQASSSAACPSPKFGYLGDPKRNIKLLDTHLVEAQKKRTPKHAARYLVRHLFSKEVLICSSVGAGFQGLQPLDPNKLAAMREYLAASFPNCDLSEHGKDWRSCISGIRSLIRYCKANNPMKKHADRTQGPMNPDAPAAADPNDERDGSESSSQTSQQAAASETTENGASLRNSEATPGGVNEPSADSSGMPCENLVLTSQILEPKNSDRSTFLSQPFKKTCQKCQFNISHKDDLLSFLLLEYFGNPHRNIQIPHSILDIAKSKSRPELSARYLIRNLFTDEVLMKSNVYGHPGHGIYALNYNKIAALREFLQDNFPTFDLAETGYDWKMCVTAVNNFLRSLRYDLKKAAAKSQPLPATTSSTEPRPGDTD
ncbi:BEN domain-containing protein 2 [Loxodonta africana]|uniref:BEN domain-containing protein 2 n=1 Tax=Loxodonta africana TaxID=9785 RepID=UPI0030CFB924